MMRIIITIILFCSVYTGLSQDIDFKVPDSLKEKSYEYLLERIADNFENSREVQKYIRSYLGKSKRNKDSLRISESYFYLSLTNNVNKDILRYGDSSITYGKSDKTYLPSTYQRKGNTHYRNGHYKKALDNYILSRKYAEEEGQYLLFPKIDYNQGLIKLKAGDYQGALRNFRQNYNYIQNRDLKESVSFTYLSNLNALSLTFKYLKKNDSAQYYNDLAIKESDFFDLTNSYAEAKIIQGEIFYTKKNYSKARDTINKYLPQIENSTDKADLAISYLYLGKSYMKLNKWKNALVYFKKTDTLIQEKKLHIIEIRENYEILVNYYKDKDSIESQLFYLEKLINFDSILYSNNTYLTNTILTKYDTPKLLQKKESLIKTLKEKSKSKSNLLWIAIVIVLLSTILSIISYKKRLIYKRRFENLINEEKKALPTIIDKKNELNIPKSTIEGILKQLNSFEEKKEFLSSSINLNSLAKKINTNSNYLSKVINFHKESSFSSYLTDLRITYAILALQENAKLRDYTIKAIAEEMGFGNAESFTKAFRKKTGLYPSYFIKQLQISIGQKI